MRDVFFVTLVSIMCLIGVTAIAFGLNAAGLLYMPFMVHQQTKIIRASNGYITAQQQLLRQLKSDYAAAGPEQQAAIRRQMSETADLIPDDVQPDIAAFLGR